MMLAGFEASGPEGPSVADLVGCASKPEISPKTRQNSGLSASITEESLEPGEVTAAAICAGLFILRIRGSEHLADLRFSHIWLKMIKSIDPVWIIVSHQLWIRTARTVPGLPCFLGCLPGPLQNRIYLGLIGGPGVSPTEGHKIVSFYGF